MGSRAGLVLAVLVLLFVCSSPGLGLAETLVQAVPAKQEVRLIGYTRARHVMDVVSKESGYCSEVAGELGDVLGPEGIFAELDRTFIDLDLEKNRVNQERLRLQIAYYRTVVQRYERLVRQELADQDTLDRQRNRLDTALQDLELARVEEKELQERRKRHILKAAPGWTVTERFLEPGEWVGPGELVGRAGDYRSLLVPFSLSPAEFDSLRGHPDGIELVLPHQGGNGLTLPAELERVSPAFDPETRKIGIELLLRQGDFERRGGLLAELTLQVSDPGKAVLLPESALFSSYEEHWLVRPGGERIPVILLESSRKGMVKVRSEAVQPGQSFQASPAD